MKNTFLTLLAFVMLSPAFAQDSKFAKIDSLLQYLHNNGKIMGAVTIREKDKVVFEKAYGTADMQAKTPATTDTRYKIGQATSLFTATLVLQLVEEKKITLDTRLSEYFPKMPYADSISIRQMLNHTSGIADYTRLADFEKYKTTSQSRKAMLERLYNAKPGFFPGARAEYSAGNYLLLGYIIQDITGKTYKENVTKLIAKAGLDNTNYFTKINPKKKEAFSYTYEGGKWPKDTEWHESVAGAAAGLQSTTADLTSFIRQLFTGKFLKKETLALIGSADTGNGLGVFYYPFAERRYVGATGTIEGFASVVCYHPQENLSFSVLLNAQNFDTSDIMAGILSIYYKLPYRFPNFNRVKVDEEILKSYEGSFTTDKLSFVINVKAVNGKLRIYAEDQGTFYVEPLSNTTFTYDNAGVIMEFTPNSFILKQNGEETKFTRF